MLADQAFEGDRKGSGQAVQYRFSSSDYFAREIDGNHQLFQAACRVLERNWLSVWSVRSVALLGEKPRVRIYSHADFGIVDVDAGMAIFSVAASVGSALFAVFGNFLLVLMLDRSWPALVLDTNSV